MTVALIGAGGVIIVALITVTGSFLQSRDRRVRMKQDAELLQLLPEDHEARDDLSRWLGREIRHHIARGETRVGLSTSFGAQLVSISFALIATVILGVRRNVDLSDNIDDLLKAYMVMFYCLGFLTLVAAYYTLIAAARRMSRREGRPVRLRELLTPRLAIESREPPLDSPGPRARARSPRRDESDEGQVDPDETR